MLPPPTDISAGTRDIAGAVLHLARGAFPETIAFDAVSVHALARGTSALADTTNKFVLSDAKGRPFAFALVSAPAAPGTVARDVAAAQRAHSTLGPPLANSVLLPKRSGECRGLTLAIFPYCEALSSHRLLRRVQRPVVAQWALRWLRNIVRRTACRPTNPTALTAAFVAPLECVASMSDLDERVRAAARRALHRLGTEEWAAQHVLMHGDLWEGNILIRRRRRMISGFTLRASDLTVIDWGSSDPCGYAILDLVRVAESLHLRAARLRAEITAHCRMLGCDITDASSHLAAALGHRAMNLEHFPRARFARMAASCVGLLDAAVSHRGFARREISAR